MSDIDVDRLKWDADYWDEVAPEAMTHYCTESSVGFCAPIRPRLKCCIPRPTKQEWEGGLPTVGERVEYDTGFQNWCSATVIAKGHDHSEDVVVIQTTNRMFIVEAGDRIRPSRPT